MKLPMAQLPAQRMKYVGSLPKRFFKVLLHQPHSDQQQHFRSKKKMLKGKHNLLRSYKVELTMMNIMLYCTWYSLYRYYLHWHVTTYIILLLQPPPAKKKEPNKISWLLHFPICLQLRSGRQLMPDVYSIRSPAEASERTFLPGLECGFWCTEMQHTLQHLM